MHNKDSSQPTSSEPKKQGGNPLAQAALKRGWGEGDGFSRPKAFKKDQYRKGGHQYCAGSHDDLTGHCYIIVGGNPMTATIFTSDSQKIKGPPADNAPEALRKFAEVLQVYADKIKTHVHLAEGWIQSRHERSVVGRP